MPQQICIPVTETSQVGEARRAAAAMGEAMKIGTTGAGRVGIVVTELANNLARYGKQGKILLRAEMVGGQAMLEVVAIDSGPGMNLNKCMPDGYSTGGTPGNGLGAVRRLSSEFDFYSAEPGGTVIASRVYGGAATKPGLKWSWINLPAPGEELCGDVLGFARMDGMAAFMIADGLGHGPLANEAAMHASGVFEKGPFGEPNMFIEATHRAMMGSRGAAVAIGRVEKASGKLYYAGVGNIAGTLVSGGVRRGLFSHNGTVGAKLPRIKQFDYPLDESGLLIMHSDGLQTRWSFDGYPGLLHRHPAVIAGVLYRDYCRGKDDVTVLIGAWEGRGT